LANGQQIAEQNLQAFLAWQAQMTDADYRQMVIRGVLSRTEIARACGFAKSSLDQNPRVKRSLKELEEYLRQKEVLPLKNESSTVPESGSLAKAENQARTSNERTQRLEVECASLKAENAYLKKQLEKLRFLHQALVETGRMPI
jgi:hypothetical protein